MNEILQIGEVAALLQIPRATLRYWQAEGLLPARKASNGYRQFTFEDLIALSDILYFRELQLPIKQIKHMTQQSWSDWEQVLTDSEAHLAAKILQLQIAQQKTQQRRQLLALGRKLLAQPYQKAPIPQVKIIPFDVTSAEKMELYIPNPNRYFQIYLPQQSEQPLHGMAVFAEDAYYQEPPLLSMPSSTTQGITFLLQVAEDHSDLATHFSQLQLLGIDCQQPVIAQYLFSAFEHQAYDYFQAWIITDSVDG